MNVMEHLTGRMRHRSTTFLRGEVLLVLQVEYETAGGTGWRDAQTSDLSVFNVNLKLNTLAA